MRAACSFSPCRGRHASIQQHLRLPLCLAACSAEVSLASPVARRAICRVLMLIMCAESTAVHAASIHPQFPGRWTRRVAMTHAKKSNVRLSTRACLTLKIGFCRGHEQGRGCGSAPCSIVDRRANQRSMKQTLLGGCNELIANIIYSEQHNIHTPKGELHRSKVVQAWRLLQAKKNTRTLPARALKQAAVKLRKPREDACTLRHPT